MHNKTAFLRRQLRKAVVDHVSDSFLEPDNPLLLLIRAGKEGREKDVEEFAKMFTEHAHKLVEVANLACSMSNNEDGIKMVRYAASQIENLCPQVVNAAKVLAARPKSKVALENMEVFRDAWINQVRILTDAVDDITTVDDFLAVSESHILEDVNACVTSMQKGDLDGMDRLAGAIRGRCGRICAVVSAEMDNYEPGYYKENVMERVYLLSETVMPNFAEKVEALIRALNGQGHPPEEKEFIEAARLVYEGVREIRRTVLLNRTLMDLEEDVDLDTEMASTIDSRPESTQPINPLVPDEFPGITGITTAREAMKKMPEQDRAKIAEQVEVFRVEKRKFDIEVSKWDDNGNDIIVLAKHMC